MALRVFTSTRQDILAIERSTHVGTLVPYTGAITVNQTAQEPKAGYLLCNGAAVSRTGYAALFLEIGTTYGVGDGSTTFNLPDLLGRSIAGAGSGVRGSLVRGSSGGVETVTLVTANLPAHTHGPGTLTVASHDHGGGVHAHTTQNYLIPDPTGLDSGSYAGASSGTSSSGTNNSAAIISAQSPAVNAGATASVGSDTAHTNMHPYLTIGGYLIKY